MNFGKEADSILPKVNPAGRFYYLGWSIVRLHNPSVAEGERGSRNLPSRIVGQRRWWYASG